MDRYSIQIYKIKNKMYVSSRDLIKQSVGEKNWS